MSDKQRLADIRQRFRGATCAPRNNILELGYYVDDVAFLLNIVAHIEFRFPEAAPWRYITTAEAAERLGIKSRSVVQLIKRELIAASKRGRDYWIEDTEIERYLIERRSQHRPKSTAPAPRRSE